MSISELIYKLVEFFFSSNYHFLQLLVVLFLVSGRLKSFSIRSIGLIKTIKTKFNQKTKLQENAEKLKTPAAVEDYRRKNKLSEDEFLRV